MSNRLCLVVEPQQDGQRLDKFLQENIDGMSRSQAQKWISQGTVTLENKPAGKNDKLRAGMQVFVQLPDGVEIDGEGEIIIGTSGSTYKRVIASQIDPMARYRKGVRVADLGKDRAVIYADTVTEPYKIAVLFEDGTLGMADTEDDISIEDRTTKGKNVKIKKGCKAVAFRSMKYLKS